MKHNLLLTAAAATLALASCGSQKQAQEIHQFSIINDPSAELTSSYVIPKARIYRTSLPSDSLVPITLNPKSNFVTSYPAPSDLTSPPVHLADGWLLDRRGIGPNTVFTRYTYADYRALPAAPDASTLAKAIVPDVRVTEIVELPLTFSEATPAKADSLIKAGLPGCTTILKR